MARTRAALLTLALSIVACVEEAPLLGRPCPCVSPAYKCCEFAKICVAAEDVCHVGDTGSYMPLEVGRSWTYDALDNGVRISKTQVVSESERVPPPPVLPMPEGGEWQKNGFKITTEEVRPGNEKIRRESWQEDVGSKVVRYHERAYDARDLVALEEWWDPGRLRVDQTAGHLVTRSQWQDCLLELRVVQGRNPMWRPECDNWTVVGPEEVVKVPAGVFKCLHVRRGQKNFWFSRGVGKVRETDRGDYEELTSFKLPR